MQTFKAADYKATNFLWEVSGKVATITLNRPDKLNALTPSMFVELRGHIDALAGDLSIGCVVLQGAGRSFCAGHDLKELTSHRGDSDGGRAFYALTMRTCADLMQGIIDACAARSTSAGKIFCDVARCWGASGFQFHVVSNPPKHSKLRNSPSGTITRIALQGST